MPITDPRLIRQYSQIHQSKTYGQSAHEQLLQIHACILDLKPATVLEYGCGQSDLHQLLGITDVNWVRYDPAIEALSNLSIQSADFVVNTDVLEHIPRSDVDDVLGHIRSLSDKVFFSIATRPARKILPNGENAHCTVLPCEEWLCIIKRHFPYAEIAYACLEQSCTILTWQSSVGSLIHGIELLKRKAETSDVHFLKRAKRRLRKIRRRLTGRA
jgi:hypothetical protein